jgi:non-specific serine/threonine protein kinase
MTDSAPGTLPAQTSGFVGRAAELARVPGLLRRSRLVTITGPGGVGKTRLAVRVVGDLAGRYSDGVHLAELSAVRDPRLLAHTIAARLAIAGEEHGPQLDLLLGYLRDRELLLILDTCEHLIDACAELADAILREAPSVTILATSRQPLDASGETVLQLRPLPVPAPDSDQAGTADAVELFAQRAAAAVPGFAVTPENLKDIITVCRRLDGVPLAIELATVRLRALPLREMAEHIDDRLRLLTGGRRSGAPRHQTLRAAIDWSHSLCTPAEQALLARLSVFAAAFDIAAAEAVCADGTLAPDDVAAAIIGLADKNMLVVHGTATGREQDGEPPGEGAAAPTFGMLDTIREFAAERLRLAGDRAEAMVRRRYVAYYLALAERLDREPAANQPGQYRRLRREHANLRAAFDYALALPGNDSAAVALATSLYLYWRISGLLREGEYWLDRALERCPAGSAAAARVLSTRGYLRVLLGDFENGRTDAETAIATAATFGDMAVSARGYSALHRALTFGGDLDEAQGAASTAAACFRSTGDAVGLAQVGVVDAELWLQTGAPRRCYEIASRTLELLPADELWCTASLLGLQSVGLFLCGEVELAKPSLRRCLAMKSELRDVLGTAFGLGCLAFVAAGEGRAGAALAAWLFGASAPLWERAGHWYTGAPAFEALHQVAERLARASLGDDRYWELHAAGAAAPLDQVIKRALGGAWQEPELTGRG